MADYSGLASGLDLDAISGLDSRLVNAGIDSVEYQEKSIEVVNGLMTNGNHIVTQPTSSKVAAEVHHRSQQGITPVNASVIHNYTDGNGHQIDMVGSGIGLKIKLARNPTMRTDKPDSYVGDGYPLQITKVLYDGVAEIGQNLLTINSKGELLFTPDTEVVFFNEKADDNTTYAFKFQTLDTSQKYLLNINDKIKIYHSESALRQVLYSLNDLSITSGGQEVIRTTPLKAYFFKENIFYETLKMLKGITDKNSSTGMAGQVLTANGDGTCEWKTPVV